ncbi:MAG: regulatory protein RecX [Lachnospiraceae bacterium]|nr:regulatory protein RecX [Lachnospiraceae bacterium]
MIITKVEPLAKTKFRIYIDEHPAFVLYQGEVKRYRLREGEAIEATLYEKIRKEVVLKRAKLRALHLLTDMGRTEAQLRTKLLRGGYPEDIVQDAITYVKSFGYINDVAYARSFIDSRKDKKSKREIYAALVEKGVAREEIDLAMEECYEPEDSGNAIKSLLTKRHYDPEHADPKETQKIMGYLTRKGFRYEDIRRVIQLSDWNA